MLVATVSDVPLCFISDTQVYLIFLESKRRSDIYVTYAELAFDTSFTSHLLHVYPIRGQIAKTQNKVKYKH